jgi:hypothetical protein
MFLDFQCQLQVTSSCYHTFEPTNPLMGAAQTSGTLIPSSTPPTCQADCMADGSLRSIQFLVQISLVVQGPLYALRVSLEPTLT